MELKRFEPTDNLNTRIQKWSENSALLSDLKKIEMEQRKLLDAELFAEPKQGTNKHELGAGWIIQSVHGTDTKLDEAAYKLIESELPDGVKDICVNWKPSLDVKVYKKLSPEQRELLDEAVTTKPKSVSMKLVPPKADKA